jgi:hypothetical protein
MSPGKVWLDSIVPTGSSRHKWEEKYMPLKRQGLRQAIVLIALFCLFKKTTSIGKGIKKVCIEQQGLMTKARPFLNSLEFKSPLIRFKKVSAIST